MNEQVQMDDLTFRVDDIYVPLKRRRTLDPETVNTIAESMLEEGQRTPIWVRRDGERLILVEGLQPTGAGYEARSR